LDGGRGAIEARARCPIAALQPVDGRFTGRLVGAHRAVPLEHRYQLLHHGPVQHRPSELPTAAASSQHGHFANGPFPGVLACSQSLFAPVGCPVALASKKAGSSHAWAAWMTKLSTTRLRPALSKSMVSLLPSTSATSP